MNCHFFLYTHSDDEIHGEGGHDELYGGFGNDVLYGGSGDDIVLGDNGNALRRYSDEVPLVKNGKLNVWHKDIILEEVGNITSIARISQKMNPSIIDADSVASASLLFVANAYTEDGSKYLDPSSGEWISDVFTYNLEKAYDDELHGGDGDDVLIGQRGNDQIFTGNGNTLAIGDGGFNYIATNLAFPRIYQMYRSFEKVGDYAPYMSGFGFTWMSDFDLYPSPYRVVDSQASIIDQLLTIDDASSGSNAVRDVLGISGSIATTHNNYCMRPMFRVIPGFVSEAGILHGDDSIVSDDEGSSFLIGDDLRGFSPLDLTEEFPPIKAAREELDNLITDLAFRLSTLGYDTIHHSRLVANQTTFDSNGLDISVACDNITTSNESAAAFVTGDTLTLLGRTFLSAYFQNATVQVCRVLSIYFAWGM